MRLERSVGAGEQHRVIADDVAARAGPIAATRFAVTVDRAIDGRAVSDRAHGDLRAQAQRRARRRVDLVAWCVSAISTS